MTRRKPLLSVSKTGKVAFTHRRQIDTGQAGLPDTGDPAWPFHLHAIPMTRSGQGCGYRWRPEIDLATTHPPLRTGYTRGALCAWLAGIGSGRHALTDPFRDIARRATLTASHGTGLRLSTEPAPRFPAHQHAHCTTRIPLLCCGYRWGVVAAVNHHAP